MLLRLVFVAADKAKHFLSSVELVGTYVAAQKRVSVVSNLGMLHQNVYFDLTDLLWLFCRKIYLK